MASRQRQVSREYYPDMDDDIQPDYDDSPRLERNQRRGEVGYERANGGRSPDIIPGRPGQFEMDHVTGGSDDNVNSRYAERNAARGHANQGYRDSDNFYMNEGQRYSQEPIAEQARRGSGGYDNQMPGQSRSPMDERYYQGSPERLRSPLSEDFVRDNRGFEGSSRDFMSDTVDYQDEMMHSPDVERGRDRPHYIQHSGRHSRDNNNDTDSVYTIDFGHGHRRALSDNVWEKLHTIRLRRKSQKSRKSARTLSRRQRYVGDDDDDEDYYDEYNEGLLPSLQTRTKPKSLHERLEATRSTSEAAETLRDNANLQSGSVALVQNSIKQTWARNRSQIKGWLYQLELWASTFKEIEGRFGMATVSYFRFTRWLMFLNLYIFLLMFCVVVIPYWALTSPSSFSDTAVVNHTNSHFIEADQCTSEYREYINNITLQESVADKVLDFIQGTGWMERTELFYGIYYNRTYPLPNNSRGTYDMSLAYLLTTGICFLISFILIVKNSGESVKEAVVDQESSRTLYCNKVFCGWDYCISNEKAAKTKIATYRRELEDDLKDQRRIMRQANRTTGEKCRLFFVRTFVHLFVMCTLAAALYLIYYTTDKLLELEKTELSEFVALVIQYLPSLTITILNFLVPLMFTKVVIVENYNGSFELKITLVRTVLLRLASLGVLIISLYIQLLANNDDQQNRKCGNQRWENNDVNGTTPVRGASVKCWETYVGQQFYKLALLDFVSVVLLTFLVEFPRKLFYTRLQQFKIVKLIGEQEFDLPKNVLDIVYSQTLCWLGMFFSPMIPAITLLKVFVIFYVKRLTVLNNCIPPIRPYRASRSNSFFMTVLLFSFILSVIPLGYIIGNISPSQSCGPFRLYSHDNHVIFDTITNSVRTWPVVAKEIFFYLGTVGFFVPAIILLCLLMYYYWAASQGYKKMEQLLKEQLKMEGRDRQFLLSRVNEVIQRGELGTAVNG